MEIKTISQKEDKDLWNQFLLDNAGSFLQSFEWGEFQKKEGKKIWRVQVRKEKKVLAQAQISKEIFSLAIKSCFYMPFGPTIKKELLGREREEVVRIILEKAKELSKSENAIFLLVESLEELPVPPGFLAEQSEKRIQPQKTLLIDLAKTEKEISENFKAGTRYNIRLAQRKGIKVKIKNEYVPEFYRLIKKASERKDFSPFREGHYKKLFQVASHYFQVKMFLGEYRNKIIAAYILIIFGKIAVCLHGASDRKYRQVKSSDILQWHRIKYAKKMGCWYFDFWGIDEKKWLGITKFKKGFGGKEHNYPQGKEIIFQPFWHKAYKIFRKIL